MIGSANQFKHVPFATPCLVKPIMYRINLMHIHRTMKSKWISINGTAHMHRAIFPINCNGARTMLGFAQAAMQSNAPATIYGCAITGVYQDN
jgi:hypothetical protein